MREFLKVIQIEWMGFPKMEAISWIFKYLRFKFWPKQKLNDWEMRVYSQNGEDGIVSYILGKIGTTNKFFVEFGVENGQECNTRYLRDLGWQGLWMDKNFANKLVKKETVTPSNIEKLFKKYQVPKQFDILSIDIDSYDYWIWKAIKIFQPRLVVIEYNSMIPINKSLTVKYEANFDSHGTNYFGASLKALTKLGKSKGYKLAGCDSKGINAFFVRQELANNFPQLSLKKMYRPPKFGRKISNRKMMEV